MSYIPTHFTWPELLPESVYRELELLGRLNRCALLLDDRILITADRLRQCYGKLVCNTWPFGGQHQFCGYRPQDCTVGAALSQHCFGRAVDLVPVQDAAWTGNLCPRPRNVCPSTCTRAYCHASHGFIRGR